MGCLRRSSELTKVITSQRCNFNWEYMYASALEGRQEGRKEERKE